MTMLSTIIKSTDSYKFSHYLQYPSNTAFVSSYIEARGISKDFPQTDIVFFGIQPYLKKYLDMVFTDYNQINLIRNLAKAHREPFNSSWEKMSGLPVPLKIKAIPEGSVVPVGTPLVQVENTNPEFFWLTSYIETSLLRAIWYPTTVATLSFACKNMMRKYWKETVNEENLSGLNFALHDFGARGVSSQESAELGGMAHLLNFKGSDTFEAIEAATRYYNQPFMEPIGFSVPAAEHSTITSWSVEREKEAYENMIYNFSGKNKIYSVVSDSYDVYNAVENIIMTDLLQSIKDKKGRFVIRPDSGEPIEVISSILKIIEQKIPNEIIINKKGYKVLPDYLRIFQGDGVEYNKIEQILTVMKMNKWSAKNFVFGMGGALLQKVNRDSLKFAMKQNAIKFKGNDKWIPVYKKPKTDSSKSSKAGYINSDIFETVFENGEILINKTFDEIRLNINKSLDNN